MERVYPRQPLEQPKDVSGLVQETHPEHQKLLAPPTYDQATGTATATPALTTGPAPTPAPPPPTGSASQHTVIILPDSPYGPEPQDVQCPYCHNYARTRISYRPNSRTHLIALVLCLLQLYCFVCLPYCISSCMNANHYCGMCNRYLGTYLRK